MQTNSQGKEASLLDLINNWSDLDMQFCLEHIKASLKANDLNTKWLQSLTENVDRCENVSELNLYEKLLIYHKLKKVIPKLHNLEENLNKDIRSIIKISDGHQIDFNSTFVENVLGGKLHDETDNKNAGGNNLNAIKATMRWNKNVIECMVCNIKMLPFPMHAIQEHISGIEHKERQAQSCEDLVVYDKFWKNLPMELQDIQLQFRFIDKENTMCDNCELTLPLANALLHTSEVCRASIDEKLYPKELVDKLMKKQNIVTMRRNVNSKLQCLLCPTYALNIKSLTKQINEICIHVSGKGHKQNLKDNYENLLFYQNFWSNQPIELFKKQNEFQFINKTITECVKCNQILLLKDVRDHSLSLCLNLRKDQDKWQCTKYDDPQNNLSFLPPYVVMEEYQYPFVFCHGKSKFYCLICNASFADSIENHLKNEKHCKELDNEENFTSLKKYHDFWSSLPVPMQLEQDNFGKDRKNLVCMMCRSYFPYDLNSLKKHLHRESPKSNKANKVKNHKTNVEQPLNIVDNASAPLPTSSSTTSVSSNSFETTSNTSSKCTSPMVIDALAGPSNVKFLNCISRRMNPIDISEHGTPLIVKKSSTVDNASQTPNGPRKVITPSKLVSSKIAAAFPTSAESTNNSSSNPTPKSSSVALNGATIADDSAKRKIPQAHQNVEDNNDEPLKIEKPSTAVKRQEISNSPTSSNFVKYHDSVTGTIYGDDLLNYYVIIDDVKYPVIQHVGPYKHCLVCAEGLSSVLIHLNSDRHVDNTNNFMVLTLLKDYHEVFSSLPADEQTQQKYFRKDDNLTCVLCSVQLNYDAEFVLKHVRGEKHRSRVETFEPDVVHSGKNDDKSFASKSNKQLTSQKITEINENLLPTEVQVITKSAQDSIIIIDSDDNSQNDDDDDVQENILSSSSSQLNEKEIDLILERTYPDEICEMVRTLTHVEFNTVQVNGEGLYECLVCEHASRDDNALIKHVTTNKHANKMTPEVLKKIEVYHSRWKTMSKKYKIHQRDFTPINNFLTFCKLCCMHVRYSVLPTHVLNYHMSNTKHDLMVKLEKGFFVKSDKMYEDSVMKALYRNNIDQCNVVVNLTSCPLIRTIRDENECLICWCSLKVNRQSVAEHIESPTHRKNMSSAVQKKRVLAYHTMWMTSKKKNTQMQQVLFVGQFNQFHCLLCNSKVKRTMIMQHIGTAKWHANLILDADGNLISPIGHNDRIIQRRKQYIIEKAQREQKKLKKSQKLQFFQFDSDDDDDGDVSVENDEVRTIVYSRSTGSESSREPTPSSSSKEPTPSTSAAVSATPALRVAAFAKLNGTVEGTPASGQYHPSALAALYKNLLGYCEIIDNVSYPTYRRTLLGIRCVVCNDDKVSSVDEHAKTEKHEMAMSLPSVVDYLRRFHAGWTGQPLAVQLEQVCLVKGNCVVCNKVLKSDREIFPHVASERHTKMRSANAKLNKISAGAVTEKVKYQKSVETMLYKRLSQHTLVVKEKLYPLLRDTIDGIKCILCHDSNVDSATKHVYTAHHRSEIVNKQSVLALVKFHEFWSSLPDENQQINQQFVVKGRCVMCETKLTYEEVTEHMSSREHLENVKELIRKPENKAARLDIDVKMHQVEAVARNPDGKHVYDMLPIYLTPQLKLLVDNDNRGVQCKCCNVQLGGINEVRVHLDSDVHAAKGKIPKTKMKYNCDVCAYQCKSEERWIAHLLEITHQSQCDMVKKSRRTELKEHYCRKCAAVVYGDKISILRHSTDNSANEELVSLNSELAALFASRQHVIDESDEFVLKATIATKQDQERLCCHAIIQAVKEVYPKCTAYVFGSRVTELGYKSDLDIFLDIGDMYEGKMKQSTTAQAEIVNRIGNILKKSDKFSRVVKIASARTPIVQAYHKETDTDCDISFRHGLSVENTSFIRFCLDLQPVLRPTLLYLKEWYKKSNLPQMFTSYALTMLMIFYMQKKNHLLSVAEIRKINGTAGLVIDGWETINYAKPLAAIKQFVEPLQLSAPDVLKGFFEFYAMFDFDKNAACPLMGHEIPKANFKLDTLKLPVEMTSYVRKLYKPNHEELRTRTAMCVQDPFDLSHNVTKRCTELFVRMFQQYCSLMTTHLSALK